MSINACVIGWPIKHSRSPLIHSHWLGLHGINGTYTKQEVTPDGLEHFLSTMQESGFAGCNVTVPHKEAALNFAAQCDDAARIVGAANTLWFESGVLQASNTDAYGFLANLDERAPRWDENKSCALVLGAGGAARAILHALGSRSFRDIILVNRTRSRADALANHFKGAIRVKDWEKRYAYVEGCTLLVNTTTLGMTGQPSLEFDLSSTGEGCVVTDLVYAPLKTQLLAQAEAKGLRTVDGLGMLLHQAVPGFEKWFGVRPEVSSELRDLIIKDIKRQ
jgi:shikimate dehydrogenase